MVVNLVPLYGADGQRHVSSLLTIGDTQILLDCGWTEEFNVADLAALKSVSSTVDAVLISQPDLEHCGGMPYLYGRLGCKAPAYMSMPTNRFGQLLMYDCYLSIAAENPEFNAFTLEDVKHAFDLTSFGGPSVQLRYLEEAGVKGGQVTVSASNSGHMLGGSVWRITKATETVVYAPVFNHKNEKHLAKAAISTLFKMPSAVITGASAGTDLLAAATGSTSAGSGSAVPGLAPGAVGGPAGGDDGNADRVKSDKDVVARDMVDTCLQSLRQGGNVLIPCDTAGRVLEVLLRLDGAFGMHHHFPIYFLNHGELHGGGWGCIIACRACNPSLAIPSIFVLRNDVVRAVADRVCTASHVTPSLVSVSAFSCSHSFRAPTIHHTRCSCPKRP